MNYQIYQNLMFLTSSDSKRTLIFSCLQIPPRENWWQYVRRVYATAINFPCIITLVQSIPINQMNIAIPWLGYISLTI